MFTTQGVNAPAPDPIITEDQILGKVVGIVPLISLLNHVVKSQLGFFVFIFCPLVLIIVLEVLQTITDIQIEKNEIQEIKKENKKEIEKDDKKELKDDVEVSEEKSKQEEIKQEKSISDDEVI